MVSTFKIFKVPRGYKVVQTTKNVYTGSKSKKIDLGTFSTNKDAQTQMRMAKQLVK